MNPSIVTLSSLLSLDLLFDSQMHFPSTHGAQPHETPGQNPAETTSDNVSYVRFVFDFPLDFRGSTIFHARHEAHGPH